MPYRVERSQRCAADAQPKYGATCDGARERPLELLAMCVGRRHIDDRARGVVTGTASAPRASAIIARASTMTSVASDLITLVRYRFLTGWNDGRPGLRKTLTAAVVFPNSTVPLHRE